MNPKHIAIILDGNGRWAKRHLELRSYGHKIGLQKISEIAKIFNEKKIQNLTVFCFSTENWKRSKEEVDYLMYLPTEFLNQEQIRFYNDQGIKINWIGRKTKIPENTKQAIEKAVNETKNNNKMILTFAFDYGSWEELISSIQKMYESKLDFNNLSEEIIKQNLYTKDLEDVDLVIRTGGEQRLSNFLLLQSAYAELYFSEVMWPDFDLVEIEKILNWYSQRDRKFGGVKNNG